MSTMLKTVNPQAAAQIGKLPPLPGQGDAVIYFLRPGQVYSGRQSAPALVIESDPDNRVLKLLVFYDHQDTMTIDRVPQRIGNEMGWEYRDNSAEAGLIAARQEIVALESRLESFMEEMAEALWGKHDRPKGSVEDRLLAIEKKAKSKNSTA